MTISSRTPEGMPGRCPICNSDVNLEPSILFGDAPCPKCGNLLWFLTLEPQPRIFEHTTARDLRARVIAIIARQLGVEPGDIAANPSMVAPLRADSLDVVELVMELEEEL